MEHTSPVEATHILKARMCVLTLSTLNSWGYGKQNLLRAGGVLFHIVKTIFEYVC